MPCLPAPAVTCKELMSSGYILALLQVSSYIHVLPPDYGGGFTGHLDNLQDAAGRYVRQTRRATWVTRRSLASCCAGVSGFPASPEAKPHCGLTASRSRGT